MEYTVMESSGVVKAFIRCGGELIAEWRIPYWDLHIGDLIVISGKPYRLISGFGPAKRYVIYVDKVEN